jgi:anti-sigma regulatory factor (Ser/Thr protein kinase)
VPPTTAELVHDRSLGDLLTHRDVVPDGLEAPQRTTLADALDGEAEDQLLDAVLVASQLIANAIQHSSGAVLRKVEVYELGAALGVVDRGADITAVPARPANSPVDNRTVAANGHGLFIVDRLASAWSVEETKNEKIVIAILTLPAGPRR